MARTPRRRRSRRHQRQMYEANHASHCAHIDSGSWSCLSSQTVHCSVFFDPAKTSTQKPLIRELAEEVSRGLQPKAAKTNLTDIMAEAPLVFFSL
mmetsp:Transcript_34389/g.82221  ORF Transcript_34389/g.82221 Transcript_34389/m.82221 type:complete len:95 (-) Transcript_34389:588-872(-)